jgi:hypothetical protein
MRTKVLTLLATAMTVVGFGVLPSLASAATSDAATAVSDAGVFGVPSLQVKNDCGPARICLWSGQSFGGQQSFWNGSDLGFHALANIDPQSVYNHTGERLAIFYVGILHNVELGIYPGETFQFGSPYSGGFEIRTR